MTVYLAKWEKMENAWWARNTLVWFTVWPFLAVVVAFVCKVLLALASFGFSLFVR